MSSALITQLSKMTDEELLNAYNTMVQKSARILLGDVRPISKLERIKSKYSYVEAEIAKRKLSTPLTIASIDITKIKLVEKVKLDKAIAELGLTTVIEKVL